MNLLFILFLQPTYADTVLSNTIAELCNFDSDKPENSKMICGEYLANCIINRGINWEDKHVIECYKKFRSSNEEEKLQGPF